MAGGIGVNTLAADAATHVCRDGANNLSTCSSSRKFKHDISYLNEEENNKILQDIINTQVATFRYKDDHPEILRYGIIAEEAPAPVRIIDEHNNTNIDFMSVEIGYTWAGIKALAGKVEKLERENNELKERIKISEAKG